MPDRCVYLFQALIERRYFGTQVYCLIGELLSGGGQVFVSLALLVQGAAQFLIAAGGVVHRVQLNAPELYFLPDLRVNVLLRTFQSNEFLFQSLYFLNVARFFQFLVHVGNCPAQFLSGLNGAFRAFYVN